MFNNINITLIAAMSKNHIIGNKNQLPWHLPKDLRHFKNFTSGKNLLMGRKTYQSIFSYINKPLPKRNSFVLSNSILEEKYTNFSNVHVFQNLKQIEEFMHANNQTDLYVIGGEQIYKQTIEYANELIISYIDIECEGDAFFPEICSNTWVIQTEELVNDEIDFTIKTYKRPIKDI